MENLVAIINHSLTVSDKDDCTLTILKDVFQNFSLRIRIKGAGSLVKQHDTSWTKQGTSNSDALSLSLTQTASLF